MGTKDSMKGDAMMPAKPMKKKKKKADTMGAKDSMAPTNTNTMAPTNTMGGSSH